MASLQRWFSSLIFLLVLGCEQTSTPTPDTGDDFVDHDTPCDITEIPGSTLQNPQFLTVLNHLNPARYLCGSWTNLESDYYLVHTNPAQIFMGVMNVEDYFTVGIELWKDVNGRYTMVQSEVTTPNSAFFTLDLDETGFYIIKITSYLIEVQEYKLEFWSGI